ncbi:MAG: type II secretion system F family protein [Nitrospirae bacterium]|nr:MAG: type II secretion system F family protein [Nitrospirota bacterium]
MPVFLYAGKHRSGRPDRGEVEAQHPKDALRLLRERGVAVTYLREQSIQSARWSFSTVWGTGTRITRRDRAVFTRQLAALLSAGVPLLMSLNMLAASAEPLGLRRTVEVVRLEVKHGTMLSASLRRHPRIFPDWYTNMVEIGEVTGQLDRVLTRLAIYEERSLVRRKNIFSALAYPMVLVGLAGAVWCCLMIWLVPLFGQLFAELGGTLPWLTQAVLDGSRVIRMYGGWVVALAILACVAGWMGYRTPRGRLIGDSLFLRLPLFGNLLRKSAASHFAETLAMLLRSGVPILDGLRLTAAHMGNAVMAQAVRAVRVEVSRGTALADPLARSGVFPPLVAPMIAVGESTGSLDAMLEQVAALYEQETAHVIGLLTALLEPAAILLIGLSVGVLVVAMYLPIFTMGALIG